MEVVAQTLEYFESEEMNVLLLDLVTLWTASDHPFRIRIFGIEQRPNGRVLLMAPEPPYSLSAFIRAADRAGVTAEERAGWAVARVLGVVDAVATLGAMHGEIVPQTLRFEADGRLMLLPPTPRAELNRAVTGRSTFRPTQISWLSPEGALGRPRDGRSDVYQLGLAARAMLGGPNPFPDCRTEMDILVAKSKPMTIANLRSMSVDVPAELDAAISRALEYDPAKRFASVEDFARALAPFAFDQEMVPSRIAWAARTEPPTPPRQPHFGGLVERPCSKRWDELTATDKDDVRHCGQCALPVQRARSVKALLPLAGSCVFYDPNDPS